ncbi:MAG: adenosine deaminase [Gammaproteobacteria bacterium]
MRKLLFALFGTSILCTTHVVNADTLSANGQATASYLKSLEKNPDGLLIFLNNLPKGGDLHNHRSGSAYAENMLSYASADNMCVHAQTDTISQQAGCPITAKNLADNSTLYNQLINAWSMRDFVATPQDSAHDHFFDTFLKFLAVSSTHRSQNLTEIVNRAGNEHELYLETMITAGTDKAIAIGNNVKWNGNFADMRQQLDAAGIPAVANSVSQELNQNEAYMNKTLQCGTAQAQAGCHVTVRYQYIALRGMQPAEVFAQLLTGFELANKDSRVVAVNIVAPEDNYYALRDYHLHMQMFAYLHQLYPNVHIDLHAGELTLGLVTPENLTFHIRDAVETADAERIGHGVDIAYETNANQLLQEMAAKHIAVEICLTSNDKILSSRGNREPLELYLKNGVPVVLATDDEGVLRTDLTHEYQRAILTYKLDYPTVKAIIRNSLTYNFMPGQSVWSDAKQFTPVTVCARDQLGGDKPSPACAAFLKDNPKAQLQWQLENQLAAFEKQAAATYRAQAAMQ